MRSWIFLAAFLIHGTAYAQAFGVEMGAPVSKYSGQRQGNSNSYVIKVPQPNEEFESYMAVATPQTGVCKVTGIGKTYRNDNYGTSAKAAFHNLKTILAQRYGNSKDFDFLHAGALWKEPREWVWSIYKNERTLASFWDAEERSNLPASLNAFTLSTNAVDTSGAYLRLSYEFSNFDACKRVMNERSAQGL